jgi:hypothetical protein
MKLLIAGSLNWESEFFKNKFDSVKELNLQNTQRQFVKELYASSSFDLKVKFPSEMMICEVDNQIYNQKFFPFRKLNR